MSGSGSSRRGARHGGYAANSFRTEAIVLRTHRLGEADRIVEALTPGHGLVRAVAKGVRKTSSRLGSVVEPFMHSTLQLARGRGELHTVSQAQLLHPYATMLAADYDAYTVAEDTSLALDLLGNDRAPDGGLGREELGLEFRDVHAGDGVAGLDGVALADADLGDAARELGGDIDPLDLDPAVGGRQAGRQGPGLLRVPVGVAAGGDPDDGEQGEERCGAHGEHCPGFGGGTA